MPIQSRRRVLFAGVLATATVAIAAAAPSAMAAAPELVATQTNDPSGNAVRVFERGADGALAPLSTAATGGRGTGAGLGSQGAVAFSEDGRYLLAVDAGSDDVAAFRVKPGGRVELADRVASGGDQPVSVTVRDRRVYVLNAGETPGVAGFRLGGNGDLRPIEEGSRALSPGASGAAQVSVAPDGRALVVSERTANRLETLPLDAHGRPGAPVVTASAGAVPFGFAFDPQGRIVVSEAAASTVSSYALTPSGALHVITASAPTLQGAACWIAITPNGRYAYSANASTGSITGFSIADDGSLTRIPADGRSASSPRPADLDTTDDGRFLYAINSAAGEITAYGIGRDGTLTAIPGATGLAAGAAGLAAS